ncbi:hypothetical protein L2E82_36395 [Cichorium intybus]|uniref:Uncharacterized protein n=1 Tax=Cichorium intybus TaxID=13427 RepID=A0ACB9BRJ1_CICIN|nr:hypothetical protein L2E82_36395 [Cichorium intybus]
MAATAPAAKPLHPVYTLTNIQHKVLVLDGTKVSYSSWVTLFQLHAKGYKVMSHIDGTPSPAKTDAEYEAWAEIDAIVLQWIYGTLSDDLLVRVLVTESTAYEAWSRIKAIFLNNKGSRATALEHEFNNLTLKSMPSLEAYCQKLKELGSQLNDVDCPVNDQRLVLQLVRGLPAEYDTVASYINQSLPTWETACSMLELEHHRQSARESMSHPTAMAAVSSELPPASPNYNNRRRPNNSPGQKRSNNPSSGTPSTGPRHGTGWTSPWAGPPASSFWPTPTGTPASSKSGPRSPAPAANQANLSAFDPLEPIQLGEALQTMTMDPVDDQWYMDSGATNHLTGDQGKIPKPSFNCPVGSIFVGNGASVPVCGSGSSTIQRTTRNLHLNNILYTPNIIKYLISVRKFSVDNNVSIEFDPHGFSVKDFPNGQMLSRHNSSSKLYPLTYPITNAAFLTSTNGLLFRFSCPYTSQQNGKSERMIRRLNEIILTLLTHASLPPQFWVEALHTASYIHNILATKLLKFNTPMTALYHRQPSYEHLRAILSCHVTFDETSFPFSEQHSPVPVYYSFLESDPSPLIFHPPVSPPPPQPPTHHPSTPNTPLPQPPLLHTYHRRHKHPQTTSNTVQPATASPTIPPPPPPPPPQTASTHPMITRSRASTTQPPVSLHTSTQIHISPIPTSHIKALSDPHWHAAMTDEYRALMDNQTWELVGIDCEETLSPVVKPTTIRTVLTLAVSRGWSIHQLDVKNAFLHGDLHETVYMFQPPGFTDTTHPNYVCRLRKSLYGLKQAPRAWYDRFATYIKKSGFQSTVSDTSLFVYKKGQDMAYLLLYVDDIVLTTSNDQLLTSIIALLSREFAMTDLGTLHHFLGIQVTQKNGGLFLSQENYAASILSRAHMADCKPSSTPVDTSPKMSATSGNPLPDGTHYRQLAGALQYITITRPDRTYAVQQICLFMHPPRDPHFQFLKRVLRYLKGTLNYGLRDNLVSWSSKRQATISRSSAEAEYRGVANAVAETTWLRNLLLELHLPTRTATIVYCDNISAVYLSENPFNTNGSGLEKIDATKYIELLEAEVEELNRQVERISANGSNELLDYLKSLEPQNLKDLTSSAGEDVVVAMNTFIKRLLAVSDPTQMKTSVTETSAPELAKLLYWLMVVGYSIRNIEVRFDMERVLGSPPKRQELPPAENI